MAAPSEVNGDPIHCAAKVPAVAYPLAEESAEVAANIKYHSQYSPHFSPFRFEPEQAYYATAESVRDSLIKEKDAALGNGGLGRLASCFLDSMASLNFPAWGYGLRYRYGLFKQHITREGQQEVAEDWLEKFSPWEIIRHDVVFPIRFFGHVEICKDGSRKWVGGEVLQALAYDVPIPGYKTKNTVSLRLWEAKAGSGDFNLFQFNEGQHEASLHLHSKAQQICAVLYPGDGAESGKLLRLKQQFFLCSASLLDIIYRFKERRAGSESICWNEFPMKVAIQLNDTHPTLAIPELMRILMDDEGLGWDEAWDITTKYLPLRLMKFLHARIYQDNCLHQSYCTSRSSREVVTRSNEKTSASPYGDY